MSFWVSAFVLVTILANGSYAVSVFDYPADQAVRSYNAAELAARRDLPVEAFAPAPVEPVEDTPEVQPPVTTVPPYLNDAVYPWTGDPRIEQWRGLVEVHFGPSDVERALGVVRCESVGDPSATNPTSGTAGLFQHRPGYWPERSTKALGFIGDPYDPAANVAVAAWLVYHGGGWRHWAGYTYDGRYWPGCLDWVVAQGA